MKFLFALIVLMTVASATYQCGPHQCYPGSSCVFDCVTNTHGCVPNCQQVTFSQRIINSWADNNGKQPYVQVEVTVMNHGPRAVKNIIIDTDNTLKLKDNNSIWNVAQAANGDLSFPTYITPLASGKTFTFGYINKGTQAAHMYLKSVDLV
eukprot:gene13007-15299_t